MRKSPVLTFRYRVEIDGIVTAGFSEVSGLDQEIETEELHEGGVDFIHHLPKGIKNTNLVLKRGISDSDELRKWYNNVIKAISFGTKIPKSSNIYISILNAAGNDEVRFHVESAYPVKWSGPKLSGSGSEVAIETLELVHEGLVIV